MSGIAVSSALILPVYRAECLVVTAGANLGDPLAEEAELNLTDIYRLRSDARRERLAISGDGRATPFRVAEGSEIGRAGADLHLDCCATFMCPDSSTVEVLIIVEIDDGMIDATYMLPLAALKVQTDHTLVATDRDRALTRFANLGCASFLRGTHVSLADGRQVPIEDLRAGDKVLTRNHGAQPIRWIGQQTVRAAGAFAPIRIAEGVLNNYRSLTLAPGHRLFVYQRRDELGTGRSEIMVRAEQLVNDDTVVKSDGGFVDYFQLLFDQHEVIYVEGIAAESLFAAPHQRATLPEEIRARLSSGMAVTDATRAFELDEAEGDPTETADRLRRAARS